MADPSTIVALVPATTDAKVAEQIRAELTKALALPVQIIDRAKLDGLSVNFNIGPDDFGRIILKQITIVKPL